MFASVPSVGHRSVLLAQDSVTTVWDGVFTAGQAERGRQAYTSRCARCHGEELAGGSGRALAGPVFWQDWSEDQLESFYRVLRSTMPRDAPGRLDTSEYLDIVSYVLSMNGLPSGTDELTEARLPGIRVVGEAGPAPVPNFSLVRVVGCLSRDVGGQWILERATEPIRNRNPGAPADIAAAAAAELGARRFRLLSPPASQVASSVGHRVQVTGLLIRVPNDDQVNVVSVTSITDECPGQ